MGDYEHRDEFFERQRRIAGRLYSEAAYGKRELRDRFNNVTVNTQIAARTMFNDLGQFTTTAGMAAQSILGDFGLGRFMYNPDFSGMSGIEASRLPYFLPGLRLLNDPRRYDAEFLSRYYALETGRRSENWGDWVRAVAWGAGVPGRLGRALTAPIGWIGGRGLREDVIRLGGVQYARAMSLIGLGGPDSTPEQIMLTHMGRRFWGDTDDYEAVGAAAARIARDVMLDPDLADMDPAERRSHFKMALESGRLGPVDMTDPNFRQDAHRQIKDMVEKFSSLRRALQMTTKEFEAFADRVGHHTVSGMATGKMMGAISDISRMYGSGQGRIAGEIAAQAQQAFAGLMTRPMAAAAGAEVSYAVVDTGMANLFHHGRLTSEAISMIAARHNDQVTRMVALGLRSGEESLGGMIRAGARQLGTPEGAVAALFAADLPMEAAQEIRIIEILRINGIDMDDLPSVGPGFTEDSRVHRAIAIISRHFNMPATAAHNILVKLKREAVTGRKAIAEGLDPERYKAIARTFAGHEAARIFEAVADPARAPAIREAALAPDFTMEALGAAFETETAVTETHKDEVELFEAIADSTAEAARIVREEAERRGKERGAFHPGSAMTRRTRIPIRSVPAKRTTSPSGAAVNVWPW